MQRLAFALVGPKGSALQKEYIKHHYEVTPAMQEALYRNGWTNYSIFLDTTPGDDKPCIIVGIWECFLDGASFEKCCSAMASEPANVEWQNMMAPFIYRLPSGEPDLTRLIVSPIPNNRTVEASQLIGFMPYATSGPTGPSSSYPQGLVPYRESENSKLSYRLRSEDGRYDYLFSCDGYVEGSFEQVMWLGPR